MKSLTVLALAVVLVSAVPHRAPAQIANVQIYFDKNLRQTQAYCRGVGVLDTVQVVANNFNMFLASIEFSISPPPVLLAWVGDLHLSGALFLGQSAGGVTITYPTPLNAFKPAIVMRYGVVWLCADCGTYGPMIALRVDPHPGTGQLRAVEWGTYRTVKGIGMTSLICPYLIANEPTSWGRVKSLYR